MTPSPPRSSSDRERLQARISKIEDRSRGQASLAHAIREVHLQGAAAVGDDYFPSVVADMERVLGADFVFIGRLRQDQSAVDTIAVSVDGSPADNFSYELLHSPCEVTFGKGVCIHPQDVAQDFPRDQLLLDMGVDGYVGIATVGSDGEPNGIIVALYRGPVPDTEFASTLILVFAERTAAEIDRLRRDEEARVLEAQLLRTQKLESLGVLAGGLAHDFNNLLSSMLGSADLALNPLPPDHPSREHLDLIREAATDAGELCRQLLAYAGKGRFEVVPVNLSSVVRDQEKLLRTSIEKSAALHLDLAEGLDSCRADVTQIRQILLNLVVNASESLPADGGVIRISTGMGYFAAEDLASANMEPCRGPGQYVFLEVSDSGSGMTPEVREKLFDPFFTTKLTGRGLGLAAILGIVNGHSGSVRVYSELGLGSSIKVFLPASKESVEQAPTPIEEEPWRGSGQALIVDDDERVALVCSKLVEVIGFESIIAHRGQAALEIFRERSSELAVVVLDLTMPGLSGEQVFREMRKLDPTVPVVLTSGFNEQDTVQDFVGRGLAGFLQKPVRLADLRERLRQAVEQGPGL